MNSIDLILAVTGEGNAAMGAFVVMTVASIGVLAILPVMCRKHVAKVGTYAHEVSHGIVSMLTGGGFHRFHVANTGGLCITYGGKPKAVAMAGYIGTILLGAIFLARSAQHQPLVIMLQVLAVLVALSTLKAGDLHTATVGMVVATTLGLFSTFFPGTMATRFLLNLMGVILVSQGIRAMKTLWEISVTETGTGSDAEEMSHLTGRSPMHWAIVLGGITATILLVLVATIFRSSL